MNIQFNSNEQCLITTDIDQFSTVVNLSFGYNLWYSHIGMPREIYNLISLKRFTILNGSVSTNIRNLVKLNEFSNVIMADLVKYKYTTGDIKVLDIIINIPTIKQVVYGFFSRNTKFGLRRIKIINNFISTPGDPTVFCTLQE